MDETEKIRRAKYLREAADHAKRHVFPKSLVGRLIYQELIFAADNLWSDQGPALALAAEIFRLHNAGSVLPPVTYESETV